MFWTLFGKIFKIALPDVLYHFRVRNFSLYNFKLILTNAASLTNLLIYSEHSYIPKIEGTQVTKPSWCMLILHQKIYIWTQKIWFRTNKIDSAPTNRTFIQNWWIFIIKGYSMVQTRWNFRNFFQSQNWVHFSANISGIWL